MKLFILHLISALVLIDGAPPSTVKEIAKNLQELLDRSSKTNSDKQRITCQAHYCHFEDKNGCNINCNIFKKILNGVDGSTAMKIGTDKKRTKLQRRPNSADSGKVCSALCATHYSYPNPTEYEIKLLDAMDALPRKS
ncbi:hypothetical protein PRIPAC_92743 [Pristionchus pacificus]|uniref:Uncharacterized protein n=1 Tax=Pristionchus pacificus TaxID=54126 RepID=A0A454XX95_PRIPA|nr:hypothetical protein PRIPAC_92743 [Pristionchus pacificus]|eukprot:PDM67903.1 hypothetical protein PRIPAC_45947 [Pristionchus pacificus]